MPDRLDSPFARTFYVRNLEKGEINWYGVMKPLPESLHLSDLDLALGGHPLTLVEEPAWLSVRLFEVTGRRYEVKRGLRGVVKPGGPFIPSTFEVRDQQGDASE